MTSIIIGSVLGFALLLLDYFLEGCLGAGMYYGVGEQGRYKLCFDVLAF